MTDKCSKLKWLPSFLKSEQNEKAVKINLTLKRKKYIKKSVIECGKRCQIYLLG